MKISRIVCTFMGMLALCLSLEGQAQDLYRNPLLPGFYPDPSVCRVGEDYYMVNSSFEWFPGIPVHHSKDLVNWRQIGHVLDRPSQLNMKQGMKASAGVWAPTIRYIKGKYYVIVTAKQCGNTFYVSSNKPEGPWSEPVYLPDSPGIDPSLFCDDDSVVWICANDKFKEEEMVEGQTANEFIWLQRIDLEKGRLYGERYRLTHGLTLQSRATEGPHIYKINGKYYLLTAEGMTWNNHAVAMFKSDKITGPYVACNGGEPVMTHRHLPQSGDAITTTGHADLVQTQHGDWWAVMLAVRPVEGMNLLGRETFLCPVCWEGDEPKFAEDNGGRVAMSGPRPKLPLYAFSQLPARDEFEEDFLRVSWNFLRTPQEKWYELRQGKLHLQLRPQRVEEPVTPSLVARRVQHHHFTVAASVEFAPESMNEEAGLVIMQNSTNFYKLTLSGTADGERLVHLVKSDRRKNDVYETIESKVLPSGGTVVLGIEGVALEYRFYYNLHLENDRHTRVYIGDVQDASVCASNRAGGFTGSYVGLYASSNGRTSVNSALFDWFEYSGK